MATDIKRTISIKDLWTRQDDCYVKAYVGDVISVSIDSWDDTPIPEDITLEQLTALHEDDNIDVDICLEGDLNLLFAGDDANGACVNILYKNGRLIFEACFGDDGRIDFTSNDQCFVTMSVEDAMKLKNQ